MSAFLSMSWGSPKKQQRQLAVDEHFRCLLAESKWSSQRIIPLQMHPPLRDCVFVFIAFRPRYLDCGIAVSSETCYAIRSKVYEVAGKSSDVLEESSEIPEKISDVLTKTTEFSASSVSFPHSTAAKLTFKEIAISEI